MTTSHENASRGGRYLQIPFHGSQETYPAWCVQFSALCRSVVANSASIIVEFSRDKTRNDEINRVLAMDEATYSKLLKSQPESWPQSKSPKADNSAVYDLLVLNCLDAALRVITKCPIGDGRACWLALHYEYSYNTPDRAATAIKKLMNLKFLATFKDFKTRNCIMVNQPSAFSCVSVSNHSSFTPTSDDEVDIFEPRIASDSGGHGGGNTGTQESVVVF